MREKSRIRGKSEPGVCLASARVDPRLGVVRCSIQPDYGPFAHKSAILSSAIGASGRAMPWDSGAWVGKSGTSSVESETQLPGPALGVSAGFCDCCCPPHGAQPHVVELVKRRATCAGLSQRLGAFRDTARADVSHCAAFTTAPHHCTISSIWPGLHRFWCQWCADGGHFVERLGVGVSHLRVQGRREYE